jgi:hypothetical protein
MNQMDAYNILDIYKGLMYIAKKVKQKKSVITKKNGTLHAIHVVQI